jgi:hypothetical protein
VRGAILFAAHAIEHAQSAMTTRAQKCTPIDARFMPFRKPPV